MDRRAWLCLALLVCASGCAVGIDDPAPAGDADVRSALSDTAVQRVHTVTVADVVDGDTMDVRYENGSDDTVRLLGVDTPEVETETDPAEFEGIPETAAGREWLREWGYRASEFARERLDGETVRIVVDRRADVRGSYGRLLVYVYHDDENFNRLLLEEGYAGLYDSEFSERAAFEDSETRARADDVGLWGFGGSAARNETASSLVVARIHADAEGDDHENLDDEYVVFENAGAEPLNLSGWRVSDEAGHTYVFPDGFVLDAGQRVTLYSGDGTDTATAVYWHSDGAVWNNGSDTVYVRSAAGDRVLADSYG
jgi:micrococcal nuclease